MSTDPSVKIKRTEKKKEEKKSKDNKTKEKTQKPLEKVRRENAKWMRGNSWHWSRQETLCEVRG